MMSRKKTKEDRPTDSESFEARWFNPPSSRMAPLSNPYETRRGYRPPPPSQGLAFAGVAMLLVGASIAGTVFFLSPAQPRSPSATGTTTITNAEVTPAPAEPPTPVQTVTPNDLPAAPPAKAAAAPNAASARSSAHGKKVETAAPKPLDFSIRR
jgi:hypothetical protein